MIAEGLDTLKNMAHDMNEVRFFLVVFVFPLLCLWCFSFLSSLYVCQLQEFDRQVPLMDEIDTKVRIINFLLYPKPENLEIEVFKAGIRTLKLL